MHLSFLHICSIILFNFLLLTAPFHSLYSQSLKADPDNGGIKLPAGFGAIVVVPELGKARHIAVSPDGTVFVKLRKLKDGKGIYVLQDKNGDGKADVVKGYDNYGGTGITIYKNYLYASSDSSVYRYPIGTGAIELDESKRETIVSGLPYRPQHEAKTITINAAGKLYVNIGAPSNACQETDRTKDSPGIDPCPLLETFGGVWEFDAEKKNQFKDGIRYATGLRNCVALEWNVNSNELYALPHGRDQLNTLFPNYYTDEQNAELPSEEFLQLKKGANGGWPYSYYDHFQHKKLLAPEYGGDGHKTSQRSEEATQPLIAFPGHWAPNDLLFYQGSMFPAKYKQGAFIAFHGSWNRAPLKQGGYFVAFVPFKDGKPSGDWEVFAEGFAGGPEIKSPNDALHRPMGLAEGPDGSLYITDSVKGTIWRIIYTAK